MWPARLTPFGSPSPDALARWAEALRLARVELGGGDGGDGDTPLIVAFDSTRGLAEHVNALSGSGQRRLIAVSFGAGALTNALKWELLDAGAGDVLCAAEPTSAGSSAARFERWHAIDSELRSPEVVRHLVGGSRSWLRSLSGLVEAAKFGEEPVLVTGESGTGKELAARLIHALDPRTDKRQFVVIDCTTIVPALSGSELFGHEKGAYTGAASSRDGAFASADGGTLFLDEIGELPIEIQAALLRVIQEGIYKRVGSDTWRRANFRLVCATHRELTDASRFRSDLYHRLACWRLHLPPLRERPDDILPLFEHFARLYGVVEPRLDATVVQFLKARNYPGNVRELKQLAARICRRHVGGAIGAADIPEDERPRLESRERAGSVEAQLGDFVEAAIARGWGLKGIRRTVEDAAVSRAIERCSGSLARAAEILEVTPRALQLRLASRREEEEATELSGE